MRPIEHISDPEQLRQVAYLLEKENEKLHARLQAALKELSKLRGEVPEETLQLELTKLQAEMARLSRRLRGNPSERRSRGDGDEARAETRRGHGPREQPQLPLREETHELEPSERKCPSCSGELEEWRGQFEESEEITVVRRRFELVKHRRKKYRCRCNGAVVTAPGPDKLIPGGRYSVEFALSVAIDKYLDHQPLERQVRAMGRDGLVVTSQTLWDQLVAMAKLMRPSLGRLKMRLFASPYLHADETWWRLMNGKAPKNWWSWCLTSRDVVLHQILPTRSNESARLALGDYAGTVVADAYSVYKSLARAGPEGESPFVLAHCWAHVRRHFVELEEVHPDRCREIVDGLIAKLYAIEAEVPKELPEEEQLALRHQLRQEKSRPVTDQIREWAYTQPCSPGSELRKAIEYMLRIWVGLTRFLDDPRLPLDNNAAERALRNMVLGRKNDYG